MASGRKSEKVCLRQKAYLQVDRELLRTLAATELSNDRGQMLLERLRNLRDQSVLDLPSKANLARIIPDSHVPGSQREQL